MSGSARSNMVAEPGAVPTGPPGAMMPPLNPEQQTQGIGRRVLDDAELPPTMFPTEGATEAADNALAAIAATLESVMRRLAQLEVNPAGSSTVAGIQSESNPVNEQKRLRMTERKAYQKLEGYNGSTAQFETWAYKLRGFLNSEIGFRPLLEWIERVAILEEDDGG